MSIFYETDDEFTFEILRYIHFRQRSAEHRSYTDCFFSVYEPSEEEIARIPIEIPEGVPAINISINIISILAMAFCRRTDSQQAIQELYRKHEKLMLQIASTSPIVKSLGAMKFVLPGEKINSYKMALCLLEAAFDPDDRRDEKLFQAVAKSKKFFLVNPHLSITATCFIDVEPEIKASICQELMHIAKKYNSRIVRDLKRTSSFNFRGKMEEIYTQVNKCLDKDEIAPSCTRAALSEEMILRLYIGALDMHFLISDRDTLMDAFFLGVTPLELSADFFSTYILHKDALKNKTNRLILNDTASAYTQMVNYINCHASSTVLDELFHIANCAIEQFLLPGEKNITESEVRDILTVLYSDEGRSFETATEDCQDFIFGLSCYVVLVAKAYRRFIERYNEELNLSTLAKIHNVSEQEDKHRSEVSGLKTEIQTLRDRMEEKEKSAATTEDTLKETIRKLETENKRLKQQISSSESNTKELTALREYVYHQEEVVTEADTQISREEMCARIMDRNVTILGGHPNWMNKLKETFPSWEYIPIGINTFPKEKVANSELVVIVSNFCKHSMYYRAISAIEMADVELMYQNGGNMDIFIRSIYEHFN